MIIRQAILEPLLQNGAETSAQNTDLDAHIAARVAEISEAEAKRTAKEQFAQEQEQKLQEAAMIALETTQRADEMMRKLNMTEAQHCRSQQKGREQRG